MIDNKRKDSCATIEISELLTENFKSFGHL